MEKQIEELKQQLENQCLINKELQRQNKDLGERSCIQTHYAALDTQPKNHLDEVPFPQIPKHT